MGIGKQLRANRRPRSLPSQYPRLASRTQNPQRTFMPSLHSKAATATMIITCSCRDHRSSSTLQQGGPMDQTKQPSHLSSSHLVLKQGSFVYDPARPDQPNQLNQPGPADIRLTWEGGATKSRTMPLRLQGPSWLHRGIWSLHPQGPRSLGSHSPFDLCNGAMSLFQNSRPTSSPRYDGNTSLSRSMSPHKRDWAQHIMSAQTQTVRRRSRLRICAAVNTTNPDFIRCH